MPPTKKPRGWQADDGIVMEMVQDNAGNGNGSGGWFRIDNAFLDRIADIGLLPTAVYLVLAKHADRDGYCFPSQREIARLVGKTARAVRDAIRSLEEAGLIETEQRSVGTMKTVNRYRLTNLPPVRDRKSIPVLLG